MKKFFKSYLDLVLMISALIMAGLLLWLFLETSAQIATYFSQAVSTGKEGPGGNTVFMMEEASKLNFRGLTIPATGPTHGSVPVVTEPEPIEPSVTSSENL